MSHERKEPQQAAQALIDGVLDAQRRLGHEATLSDEDYANAVERTAKGFASLTDPTEDEDAVPA